VDVEDDDEDEDEDADDDEKDDMDIEDYDDEEGYVRLRGVHLVIPAGRTLTSKVSCRSSGEGTAPPPSAAQAGSGGRRR